MENKKEKVALSSVLAGVVLTLMKFVVGTITGSLGIISEAVHSLLDLAAAIMTFFAVRFGDKPADKDHHYGHGKIESVSALIETGLLFITSFWIIYESIHRIITNNLTIKIEWYAFVIIIISIIIDISRSRALKKVAKETGSQALEADALHFSSDILSSGVVLIGLFLSLFGIKGADCFAAIGVALFVGLAGYRLGKSTINTLIDKAPEGIYDKVHTILERNEHVIDIERIRVRQSGAHLSIDTKISINRKLSSEKIKEITNNIENKIKEDIQEESEIIINTEPIKINTETILDSIKILAAKNNLSIHDLIIDELDGKKYISYDLELKDDLTIKEAHDIADKFENEIKNEIVEEETEINSHIEPLKHNTICSSNSTKEDFEIIEKAIKEISLEIKDINTPHNILVRKIENKFFISFHCFAKEDILLDQIHDATIKYEYLLQEKVNNIKKVVIHVECKE